MAIVGQSCPLWILGPKSDPFGNSYPGIERVAERLQLIAGLPQEVCSHTSFHTLHEVRTRIKAYEHLNSPWAMDIEELLDVLDGSGKEVLAVTVPAFGLSDLWEGGAILSRSRRVRMRTRDLILEGFDMTAEVHAKVFIWWPATDSLRYPFTEQELEDGRKRLKEFWSDILTEVEGGEVWLEFKPADPGDRDFFADWKEALRFVKAVNAHRGVDERRAWVNFEFAHASMIDAGVDYVMHELFLDNVVKDIVHVNSSVKPGPDQDKRVGAVNYEETQRALQMVRDSPLKLVLEHDIKCLDGRPLEYYLKSVAAVNEMLGTA